MTKARAGRARSRKPVEERARQQLRVHPADPDALQRADRRRARRSSPSRSSATTSRRCRRSPARSQPVLQGVPGAADVKVEQVTGLPVLTVDTRPRRRSRGYGLSVADVQEVIEIAVGGQEAGHRVRGRPALRPRRAAARASAADLEAHPESADPAAAGGSRRERRHGALGQLAAAQVHYVPLSSVAEIEAAPGPTRSAARTASGASWSRPTCAAATSARSSPTRKRQVDAAGEAAARATGSTWGGQFENLVAAAQAADDRRAGRAAADLRAAVHEPSAR